MGLAGVIYSKVKDHILGVHSAIVHTFRLHGFHDEGVVVLAEQLLSTR